MKMSLHGFYATLITAMSLLVFTSCSTEEPEEEKYEKIQPTFTDISVTAGQAGSIEFTAYTLWTLSSDKTWLKLSSNTAKAGKYKIDFTVTDDNQGFKEDVATLTFLMDGVEQKFKATRGPKERSIKFYKFNLADYSWVETKRLDLKFAEQSAAYNIGYKVVANFDWRLEFPEWIVMDGDFMSGKANPTADPVADPDGITTAWAELNYSVVTVEGMTGEFVFYDEDEPTARFVMPTSCIGAKYFMLSSALRDLEFNVAGLFIPTKGGPQPKYSFRVISMPKSIGDAGDYTIYNVAKRGKVYGLEMTDKSISYDVDWCSVTPGKNSSETAFLPSSILGPHVKQYPMDVRLPHNPNVNRSATIVILPNALVAEKGITGPKDLVSSQRDAIKMEFQDYVVADVRQAGSIHGLSFYSSEPAGVTLDKLKEGDPDFDMMKGAYGVDLVYRMTIDSFSDINYITLNYDGYMGASLLPAYLPIDAEINGANGWIKIETNAGYSMTFEFADNYVKERSAWIIPKDSETLFNQFALQIVQRVALPKPVTR